MITRSHICLLVACAGAAFGSAAMAQDSVGRTASGDGLTPVKDNFAAYNGSQFVSTFVVDLVPFQSSWGNTFRIGPVIKTSNASNGSVLTSAFANASALSVTQKSVVVGSLEAAYWSGAGGQNSQGVNATPLANGPTNTAPELLPFEGPAKQFGVALIERNSTAATGNTNYNAAIGAILRHGLGDSGRLYVTRYNGAASNTAPGSATASLGLGGVDSDGNFTLRVDGFGMDGTNPATVGPVSGQSSNNYVRIDMTARNSSPNHVRWTRLAPGTITDPVDTSAPLCSQTGADVGRDITAVRGAGAGSLTNANCPNIVPEELAGRPITIGSAFDAGFRYESAPGVLSESTGHLNAVNTDHRGNACYSARNFFPNSVNGTGAFLAYYNNGIGRTGTTNPLGTGGDAVSISTFGVSANGAPVGEYLFLLPDAAQNLGMSDPYSINPATQANFNTATDFPLPPIISNPQFMHYQGNTFANGGSGPVAVTVDPAGNLMVAGVVSANSAAGSDPVRHDRRNYLAVGRTSSTGGPTEWVVAAWVSSVANIFDDSTGKQIVDASGTPVGRLTTWADYNGSFPSATHQGGSCISAPAFDSVGNVYFIAATRLNSPTGEVKRLALIRGVRQESPFGFKLEKIVAERDEFVGLNSGARYRISTLNLTTTSTGNTDANGSLWSSSINQDTVDNADRTQLATNSSATLGGIVLSALINYDENGNGSYADATDQNYQAVLFINGSAGTVACPADFNGDGDINPDDLGDFINCYFSAPPCGQADFNGDGDVNPDDLGDYINVFFSGGC